MNAKKTPVNIEMVADVAQTPGGDLVIRPRPGRNLKLNRVAETIRQADGAYRLKPHGEWIGMSQAMTILDFPYNTLLRAMKSRALAAYKKSPGRWAVSLESVMDFKRRTREEPEFWEGFNPAAKNAAQPVKINSRAQNRKKVSVNREWRPKTKVN
jgi:hypothetical protein